MQCDKRDRGDSEVGGRLLNTRLIELTGNQSVSALIAADWSRINVLPKPCRDDSSNNIPVGP
jgi:hypothetical protein